MTEQTTFQFRHRRGAPRFSERDRKEYKRRVRKFIEARCRGWEGAARASKIREVAGLPKTLTEELVRELIRELLEDGVPIGSRGNGYFLIQNQTELRKVVDGLRSRQVGIEARIRLISHAFGIGPIINPSGKETEKGSGLSGSTI